MMRLSVFWLCMVLLVNGSLAAEVSIPITEATVNSGIIRIGEVEGLAPATGEGGTFQVGGASREGYRFVLQPGEGAFLVAQQPVTTEEMMVLAADYDAISGDPNVAVIGLYLEEGSVDGQFAFTQRIHHPSLLAGQLDRLLTLVESPGGTLLPAIQIANRSDATVPTEVVLYSLDAYTLDRETESQYGTVPSGTFVDWPEDARTNINADTGIVNPVPDLNAVSLQTDTAQDAANIVLSVPAPADIPGEQLLMGELNTEQIEGMNGSFASLFITESWASGVFLSHAPIDNRVTLGGGGNYMPRLPDFEEFDWVIQNGGGSIPSSVMVYGATVFRLAMEGVNNLPPIEEVPDSDTLTAALVLPKKVFAGSQSSFSITLTDPATGNGIPAPYAVELQKGDTVIPLHAGFTSAEGLATTTFRLGDLQPGEWTVRVQSDDTELARGTVTLAAGEALFIETDKPIYRPGQTLQGRILSLNNALAPLPGEVELTIADAKGLRIHRETLMTDEYGVAPFEIPLANELNFGTWSLRAQTPSGSQVQSDIEVDRYVLPSFETDVRLVKDWLLVDEDPVAGVVESRFFFGKPVQGTVSIEALRYVGQWEVYATSEARLDENGQYAFELPPVTFAAGTPTGEGESQVQLRIAVTDDTGRTEETDRLIPLVDAGVNLTLIPDSTTVKPGLQQEVLVVTQNPGGAPLSLPVSISGSYILNEGRPIEIEEMIDVVNGLGVLLLDVPEDTTLLSLEASATLDRRHETESLILNAAYSPSAFYLHLRQVNDGPLAVGTHAAFDVFSTATRTVYYDVYANGRTVLSGTTRTNRIQFPVTPEMSGQARLVVYSIQDNNELAADVLPFEVELTAPVGLQAAFSHEQVEPGDPVSVSLRAGTQSMLGVAIVDESIFALVEGRLNLRSVFAELERIYMEPQIEVHEDPDFFLVPDVRMPAQLGGRGAFDVLAENNLQVIASEEVAVPQGETLDPWMLWGDPRFRDFPLPLFPPEAVDGGSEGDDTFQEPDRVRTFFPETWVWNPQLLTDASGQATLELTAPDSITNWKLKAVSTSSQGMGITEADLIVFQDFFVEPDLPFAVIRGDRFPLRVRIFNYLDEEQTIRITLDETEALGLQDTPTQDVVVPGNSLASATFILQPETIGTFPLQITAQSSSRADAVRRDVRVEPEGAPRERVFNGVLRDATEAIVDLRLPDILPPPEPGQPEDIIREPIPQPRVDGSDTYRVAVTGSLVGQSLAGVDDLLGMPFGCGEQNMILLAPNIEVLRYLDATGQLMPEVQAKAEFFITTGYQRQLTYRRNDNSFSAFGVSDDEGSLWLTAFVLGTFSRARDVQTIDAGVLAQAATWITEQQQEDGSWEPVGFVIHEEMQGGLDGNLALTAFVTGALMDYGQADGVAVQRALDFLENHISGETVNPFVLSQIAYSLARAERESATTAIDLLLALARSDANGTYWEPHPIETTAYAALAMLREERIEAGGALEWLSTQRNSLGGYGSTQDTVVALQALTAAAIQQSRDLNSQITVWVDGEEAHTFAVNNSNFDVFQTLELEAAETITLKQTGTGRVLYQVTHAYHVPVEETTAAPSDLVLDVEYDTTTVDVDDRVTIDVSLNYQGILEQTGMLIVDVSIPTGFAVDDPSLEDVIRHPLVKRIEQAGRKLIVYIDHLVPGEPVEFAFRVKALYPVRADAGVARAYHYYEPENRVEVTNDDMTIQ